MRSMSAQLCFIMIVVFGLSAFAKDRDRGFGRGRGGPSKGNERSQRPGRVPVGNPNAAGNGCPAGTMQVVFAPDNLSFSILFDQFIAQTDGTSGAGRDLMTCDALIPIEIPAGMQMEITRVDYRGFVALPQMARARLHAMFNFRGRGGDGDRLNMRYEFQGPLSENYTLSTDLLNSQSPNTEISPCGGSTVLRVFNQLQIVSRAPGQAAQATIDSIDGQANAIYYLNWKTCTPSSGGGDRGDGRGRRDDEGRDGRGGRGDRGDGRGRRFGD